MIDIIELLLLCAPQMLWCRYLDFVYKLRQTVFVFCFLTCCWMAV